MKIIAISHDLPGATDDQFMTHGKAEALRAWQLHQEDIIRELYFRRDKPDAVLILECAGVEEAKAALDTLPMVKNGLIAFDFIPLGPYPGFARLFEQS